MECPKIIIQAILCGEIKNCKFSRNIDFVKRRENNLW